MTAWETKRITEESRTASMQQFCIEKMKEVRKRFAQQLQLNDEKAREMIIEIIFDDPKTAMFSTEELNMIVDKIFFKTRSKQGILTPLIEDPEISEIMVNGPEHIFIEKKGQIVKSNLAFDSRNEMEDVMRAIVGEVHREINERNPIVDARLENGSRVNGVYHNVAINGPILTIRKFLERYMRLEDLIANDTMTEEAGQLLKLLVCCGYNIFVSGGTSSGKTTLLNALAAAIPSEERVIIVEDSMELKMNNLINVVHMECRNSNSAGLGRVSMSDLIRSSLRMRPDRIIVGEVRGAEVMDMLNAMNTGHDGSLSTGHGNSAHGMLKRLESMYLMAMPLDIEAIRAQIAEGIDIMVHIEKFADGKRKITEISELSGYTEGKFQLKSLMERNEAGRLMMTGEKLGQIRKARLKGVQYVQQLRQLGFIP